jgi:hypothetical protein
MIYLCEDDILVKFSQVFPELNISFTDVPKIYYFVVKYMKILLKSGVRFVFEGGFSLKTVYKNFHRRDVFTAGIGYPDLSFGEKMEQLKIYDTEDDWSLTQHNDENFHTRIKTQIESGKKKRAECRRYFFYFINTSHNRDEEFRKFLAKLDKVIEKVDG